MISKPKRILWPKHRCASGAMLVPVLLGAVAIAEARDSASWTSDYPEIGAVRARKYAAVFEPREFGDFVWGLWMRGS